MAGWVTHGQYQESSAAVEPYATRAYTLSFLALAPPKPRPVPVHQPTRAPARVRHETPPTTAPAAATSGSGSATQPRSAVVETATTVTGAASSALQVRELAPGKTVAAIPEIAPPAEPVPEAGPAVPRGEYQAAMLMAPAGSACPELPAPPEWGGREISVAVAFVVDTTGRVDPSRLQIVESPGRHPAGREFYPRIYVVGTKAGASTGRVSPARYDSMVTEVVTRHVSALRFRPALVGGRPVRSMVLVACHRSPSN